MRITDWGYIVMVDREGWWFQFTVDQPQKTATIGATEAPLCSTIMTNLCPLQFRPELDRIITATPCTCTTPLAPGDAIHVMHGQYMPVYSSVLTTVFEGYFSFFCNKIKGFTRQIFWGTSSVVTAGWECYHLGMKLLISTVLITGNDQDDRLYTPIVSGRWEGLNIYHTT